MKIVRLTSAEKRVHVDMHSTCPAQLSIPLSVITAVLDYWDFGFDEGELGSTVFTVGGQYNVLEPRSEVLEKMEQVERGEEERGEEPACSHRDTTPRSEYGAGAVQCRDCGRVRVIPDGQWHAFE